MPDREKVIRGLECLSRLAQDGTCAGCAYFRPFSDDPDAGWCDRTEAAKDALALLREQEPVKPITQDAWPNPVKVCGSCGGYITYTAGRPKYCPNCGSEMKWDD